MKIKPFTNMNKVTNNSIITIGNGIPWQQQYDINIEQKGAISGWTINSYLPEALLGPSVIVTKNKVHLLGGLKNYSSNGINFKGYTSSLNDDGSLGIWTKGPELPFPLDHSKPIVYKNKVYLLGGYSYNNNIHYICDNGYLFAIFAASIDNDGMLGNWEIVGFLPEPMQDIEAIIVKDKLYILGGYNRKLRNFFTYIGSIDNNGKIYSWIKGPTLSNITKCNQIVVIKNRIYLLGGWHSYRSEYSSIIYTTTINDDGTLNSWIESGTLPVALTDSQTIVTRNNVYLLGGNTEDGPISTIYVAPIDHDGKIGKWSKKGSLSMPLFLSKAIITKNKIHLLGGRNTHFENTSDIYTASISGGLNDYSSYYS